MARRAGPPGSVRLIVADIVVDARGLSPPEPFARVIEALGSLAHGDRLRLLIDVEPRPLYAMLDRNNYGHYTERGGVPGYEVVIWERD
jgi:uncharacterized protein (DUF2249 family)